MSNHCRSVSVTRVEEAFVIPRYPAALLLGVLCLMKVAPVGADAHGPGTTQVNQQVSATPGTVRIEEHECEIQTERSRAISTAYSLTLREQPSSEVKVTATSTDATIAAPTVAEHIWTNQSWRAPRGVVVCATPDDDLDDESTTIRHTITGSPPLFHGPEVTVRVIDTGTKQRMVRVAPTELTINEGDVATYTVQLTRKPYGTVTATMSGFANDVVEISPTTLNFNNNNWKTAQTVTVRALEDTDGDDEDTSVAHGIANYATVTSAASVRVKVTDNDRTFSLASATAGEGGNAALTITLGAAAPTGGLQFNVTPTFTSGSGKAGMAEVGQVPQTVTVLQGETTATLTIPLLDDDVDEDDETFQVLIATTNTAWAKAGSGRDTASVTIEDDDTAGFTITPTTVSIDEGASGTYSVVLDSEPTDTVKVTPTSGDLGAVTVAPASLTIIPANWRTAQIFTVSGVEESDDFADERVTVTHTVASDDTKYAAKTLQSVTVNVDDSQPVFSITAAARAAEGESASLTITLSDDAPSGGVSFSVTPRYDTSGSGKAGADDVGIVRSPVMVAANTRTRTLSIPLAEDDLDEDEETFKVVIATTDTDWIKAAEGADTAVVTIEDDANDIADITVAPITVSIDEGASGTYSVVLNTKPTHSVRVTPTSDDAGAVTVAPDSRTFNPTNWNTAQIFTVTGVQDDDDYDDESVTINHATLSSDAKYTALTPDSVAVTVSDDDTRPTFSITATASAAEGANAALTITLSKNAPTGGVSFSVTPRYAAGSGKAVAADVGMITSPVKVLADTSTLDINIPLADDDLDEENETFEVVIATTDTSWVKAEDGKDTAAITITDNDIAGLDIGTTATYRVTEASGTGRTATYNVKLTSKPTHNVTVTPTRSATADATVSGALTFTPANWDTTQPVTITGVDDKLAEGDERIDITHQVTSTDGKYSALTAPSLAVYITDDDIAGFTVTPTTLNITEGGNDTYSVVLDSQPSHTVTVTPTSPDTGAVTFTPASYAFTTTNWNVAQSFTVTGVQDDDFSDETVTITHDATGSDTVYAAIDPNSVTVTVSDDDTRPTFSITATASATEGANAALTITLSEAAPTGGVPFTVTAMYSTTGNNNAVAADVGSITSPVTVLENTSTLNISIPLADDDLDEDNETFKITIATSTSPWVKAGDGKDTATITITDNDEAGFTVTPTTLSITEGGSDTYTVVLDSKPSHSVVVTPTSPDTGAVTVTPSSRTFTTANWATAQEFTVTGVQDNSDYADESVTITHDATGSDTTYSVLTPNSVTVTVSDNDTRPNFSITATASAAEGANAALTITLSENAPTGGVPFTVTATYSTTGTNNAVAADVGSITSPVTVLENTSTLNINIPLTDDDLDENNETFKIVIATSTSPWVKAGDGKDTATITITDNDAAGFTVDPTTLSITEGGNDTYSVKLNSKPSASVVVTPTSPDTDAVTVTPSSRTFTTANWATAQEFTVTGVQDNSDYADETVTITHDATGSDTTYSVLTPNSVTVTVSDNDTRPNFSITATASAAEGANAALTITLSENAPTGGVPFTVTATYSTTGTNNAVAADVGSITSPVTVLENTSTLNINIPLTDDDLDENNETFKIVIATSTSPWVKAGDGKDTATITITDNDAAGFTVDPTTLSITEGGSDTYTVVLNSKPSANVVVTPTSGDTGAVTVSPASRTFTTANWATAQSFTVTGVQDNSDYADESVTITHDASGSDTVYAAIDLDSVAVTVSDDDTRPNFSITATASATEGANASLIITLSENAPTGGVPFTVTAMYSTSGSNNAVAADVGSITSPVTVLENTSTLNINIPLTDDDLDEDNETFKIVIATSTSPWVKSGDGKDTATITITDNDAAGFTVDPTTLSITEGGNDTYSVKLNSKPSASVVVTPTSPDTGAVTVTPSSRTFTTANWATAQSFTVTGVQDNSDYADESVTITHDATGSDTVYAAINPNSVAVTVSDDDTRPTFSITATASAAEGANAALTITLSEAASEGGVPFTVTAMYSTTGTNNAVAADVGTVPSTVTVTATQTTASLSIPLTDDDLDEDNETFKIVIATSASSWVKSGDGADTATITITDNDAAGFTVTPTTLSITEGASKAYTVVLDSKPGHDVTVTPTNPDTSAVTVTPSSRTFTTANWNTQQSFTVTGVQEDTDYADERVVISHDANGDDTTYSLLSPASVVVNVDDNDVMMQQEVTLQLPPLADLTYIANRAITPLTLPQATGGIGTLTYALTPAVPGLRFAAGTRRFTGTPTTVAETRMTYTASDADGTRTERMFTLRVDPAPSDMAQASRIVLPEVARALADQTVGAVRARVRQAGRESQVPSAALAGKHTLAEVVTAHGPSMADGSRRLKDLLGDSDFTLPLNPAGEATGGGGLPSTLWGNGDFRDLTGDSNGIEYNGDLFSARVGVDGHLRNDLMVGAALSWSQADMTYRDGDGSGEYEVDLTSFHPYLGWREGAMEWWATIGRGSGRVKVLGDAGRWVSDVRMRTAAVGGSGQLWEDDRATVRLKGEAMGTRMDVKEAGGLSVPRVDVTLMRLAAEASRTRSLPGGGNLSPTLSLGARQDGGDGNTGTAAEVGGSVHYENPETGVRTSASVHALLGRSGHDEWGIQGLVRLSPGADGQGLSVTLRPVYRDSGGGSGDDADRIWARGLHKNDADTAARDSGGRLHVRLSYGLSAPGGRNGLLTPWGGLTLDGDATDYRLGLDWAPGGSFSLHLSGERHETTNADASHAVMLRGDVRF